MRESVLRDFFLGQADVKQLAQDLESTAVQTSYDVISHHVSPMADEFEIEPSHLVKLCDAVLSGNLQAEHLSTLGFCLAASDHFKWAEETEPGERVAETVYDWASPEINYPLTLANIQKFRERLLTGENTFTRQDTGRR